MLRGGSESRRMTYSSLRGGWISGRRGESRRHGDLVTSHGRRRGTRPPFDPSPPWAETHGNSRPSECHDVSAWPMQSLSDGPSFGFLLRRGFSQGDFPHQVQGFPSIEG